MVRSVLLAIPIYCMSCFKIPFVVGKNIDNLLRKFVWEGAKDTKKIPLINWETMCLLKEDGRARLRKMELQNSVLGAKLSWKMYTEPQKLWCKIFKKKYLDSENPCRILTMANADRGSATWNFLWDCRFIITNHISWHIGNGKSAKFWRDSWDGAPALSNSFNHDWIDLVESTYGVFFNYYFEQNME
ncbi:uncharacterized mitochondrial protein AtMg00310-like [Cryptomeria japonica]|uniref:uncharacterized mitochondrial protein AtMg00310-like n=1 Tax=Cryptomeria japonica TaxID=3369 RepID=UPI0027DA46E7|nr:uncharacterized mitochondrial protein AtMg00310-like [Cryptomeria japonica]